MFEIDKTYLDTGVEMPSTVYSSGDVAYGPDRDRSRLDRLNKRATVATTISKINIDIHDFHAHNSNSDGEQ